MYVFNTRFNSLLFTRNCSNFIQPQNAYNFFIKSLTRTCVFIVRVHVVSNTYECVTTCSIVCIRTFWYVCAYARVYVPMCMHVCTHICVVIPVCAILNAASITEQIAWIIFRNVMLLRGDVYSSSAMNSKTNICVAKIILRCIYFQVFLEISEYCVVLPNI